MSVFCYISSSYSLICISQVDLTHRNLESILNTLVFDGKAVMTHEVGPDGTAIKVYRATKLYANGGQHLVPGFSRTPCGICPVSFDLICNIQIAY